MMQHILIVGCCNNKSVFLMVKYLSFEINNLLVLRDVLVDLDQSPAGVNRVNLHRFRPQNFKYFQMFQSISLN